MTTTIMIHNIEPGIEGTQIDSMLNPDWTVITFQHQGGDVSLFFPTPAEAEAFGQAITMASQRERLANHVARCPENEYHDGECCGPDYPSHA